MINIIWKLATTLQQLLQRTPSNRILTWLNARQHRGPTLLAIPIGLAYLALAFLAAALVQVGAPAILNILFLTSIYNATRFLLSVPINGAKRQRKRSCDSMRTS